MAGTALEECFDVNERTADPRQTHQVCVMALERYFYQVSFVPVLGTDGTPGSEPSLSDPAVW